MGLLRSAASQTPVAAIKAQTNYIGHESFATKNPYFLDCYEQDKYASVYPSIKAISNEFMTVTPFAVDGEGKRLARPPQGVNAFYHPNQLDSAVAFREKLAVMNLTHRMTYVLVWRKEGNKAVLGGEITPLNIAGFTFLENPAITVRDKKTYYSMGAQEFSEDNVIAIPGGVDPSGLYHGYAPGIASARWATLDEYIADFQKGFFENGAVPAGQFVVTAASKTDYEDTVDKLQEAHRGSGKNNNVTYTPRPVDPVTNKPADAKIEWIPFAQTNKDIDFKSLFEQANNRIDSTFGVPASIRGVGESNNYATARVDQQNFIRFTIKPLALRIYSQITHELNRITGGLGYAFTFELDYPAVADEEKIQEETKQIRDDRAQKWVALGYSLTSVDNYLKSGKLEDLDMVEVAEDENDNPDVDDGSEVKQSPNPDDVDGVTPVPRSKIKAQVSNRDYPELYEDLDIDVANLGCIMLDTKKLDILKVVGDNAEKDLVSSTDRHDHQMGAVAEVEPHVTLLFGLLENGNVWKDKVDTLLDGWNIETVKVKDISYFDLPESYAVVAHIEETTDLLEGHNRLTLLPHVNTFSEYRPHMTLAYIEKTADLGKWLTTLNAKYSGKELKVTGINYGDKPEDDNSDSSTKALARGSKGINPKAELTDEDKMEAATKKFMRSQLDRAIDELSPDINALEEPTKEELDEWVASMLAIEAAILLEYGIKGYAEGLATAGLTSEGLQGYFLSETAKDAYEMYLRRVGASYGKDTAESLRTVLLNAERDGLTRKETENAIKNIMNTDEWRVKRLSRTELNNSQNVGRLEGMKSLSAEVGGNWEKTIQHTKGGICPLCASQEGIWSALSQPLWGLGEAISTVNDKDEQVIYINDWQTNEANDYHPNGTGTLIFRRVL